MNRIRVTKFGGPEVLKLEEFEPAEPGPGQVRLKLAAAGLNFIDIYQRRGDYPVSLPWTPGLEGAGVVDALGQGVTGVKVGDRVAYTSQPESYAEAVVVPADCLIPLPDGMSFEQGAAFPLQGMTAHYLVHEYHKPAPGDTVLIHAAAGGMGLLLTQWVKHLGATVIGTVSTDEKAQAAREAGADHTIIYTREDFVDEVKKLTGGKGVELVIDGVGRSTFGGSIECAAVRGHAVIFGSASGPAEPIRPNELQRKSVSVSGGALWNYIRTRDELLMRANGVLEGIREGWLKLTVNNILPLSHAAEAHRLLENRETTGKVVLSTGAVA